MERCQTAPTGHGNTCLSIDTDVDDEDDDDDRSNYNRAPGSLRPAVRIRTANPCNKRQARGTRDCGKRPRGDGAVKSDRGAQAPDREITGSRDGALEMTWERMAERRRVPSSPWLASIQEKRSVNTARRRQPRVHSARPLQLLRYHARGRGATPLGPMLATRPLLLPCLLAMLGSQGVDAAGSGTQGPLGSLGPLGPPPAPPGRERGHLPTDPVPPALFTIGEGVSCPEVAPPLGGWLSLESRNESLVGVGAAGGALAPGAVLLFTCRAGHRLAGGGAHHVLPAGWDPHVERPPARLPGGRDGVPRGGAGLRVWSSWRSERWEGAREESARGGRGYDNVGFHGPDDALPTLCSAGYQIFPFAPGQPAPAGLPPGCIPIAVLALPLPDLPRHAAPPPPGPPGRASYPQQAGKSRASRKCAR
ncbi:unnamed protein product [Lampetra planeri]